MKLGHTVTPYTKRNSKLIKGLSLRLVNIKLSEENIGRTPPGINRSKGFFFVVVLHPRVMKMKQTNKKQM